MKLHDVTRSKRFDLILIALIVLIAVGARLLPGVRGIDDSFITFRYSRNIIEGNGFTYNPPARVMGTTTPLFTLLMAGIGAAVNGRDFSNYAILVSAIADSVTASLLFLLMRRVSGSRWPALLIGLLWAVAPMSVSFAVGGMETSVNILWMVAAVACFVFDRPLLIGVFVGLGLLTRIDAALWIGPLLLFQGIERLTITFRGAGHLRVLFAVLPWRTWFTAGLVLLPWLVFSVSYFGTIIPRSVTAKTAVYIMPPGSALVNIVQNFSTPFFEFDTFGPPGAQFGFFLYPILMGIGGLYIVLRAPRLLSWLLYPFLYAAVFAVANPLIFRWYLAPPMPALFFLLIAGGWALVSAPKRPATRRALQRIGFGTVAALWLGTSLNAWTLHPDHGPDRPTPRMAWNKVELHYRTMSDELIQKYGVNAASRVAVADIGVVGYFTGAQIIDTVGLVSPSMSKYYPADPELIIAGQNYGVPPQIIRDTQPEYIALMEAAVRNGLARDPDFSAAYEQVKFIPTDFYGTGMILYQRR